MRIRTYKNNMEVTLTAVKRTDRVAKASGKPFVSVGIKCNKYGDQWLSGFGGPENENWGAGDVVEIEVETKGEYLNFKQPKGAARSSPNAPQAPQGDGSARVVNFLEFKVMPALEAVYGRLGLIAKAQGIKIDEDKLSYPEMDASNDSSGLDEPRQDIMDSVPF